MLMPPIRILMFAHMETNPSWNARSVSARTSALVFANALLMRSVTSGASSTEDAFTHHVPTVPGLPSDSSRYFWWNMTLRSSAVPS